MRREPSENLTIAPADANVKEALHRRLGSRERTGLGAIPIISGYR